MDLLLGLDIGTTNCKALAIHLDGQPVVSISTPTPGCSLAIGGEHDPTPNRTPVYDAEALWGVTVELVRQVLEKIAPDDRVLAVAVASMGEAGVLVDRSGSPLAPILTWHDQRTLPWVPWWQSRLQEKAIYRITGLPLSHTYSVNKILWYREQYPELWSRVNSWLCLADWITFRLTGITATSPSLASRTMLLDINRKEWSDEFLRITGLPASLMPPIYPSGALIGPVTRKAAQATGLPAGTQVVMGGHDHICAALAAGVITPGPVLDSAGTSEAILVTLNASTLDDATASSGLCCGCHTIRDKYYLFGGVRSGGVVGWISRILAGDDAPETMMRLMAEASAAPPGSNGVRFLPHLDGSGPPDPDPGASGAWLGLRLKHTRGELARSGMEGVCYAIRSLLDLVKSTAGFPIQELRAVGGGTRISFWQQLKADMIGIPIEVPVTVEVTAQGAALLAGIGIGAFTDAEQAARSAYHAAVRYVPDPDRFGFYDDQYQAGYRKIKVTSQ